MATLVIVVRILCGTVRGGSGWTSMTNEQPSHAGCGQQPEGLFSEPETSHGFFGKKGDSVAVFCHDQTPGVQATLGPNLIQRPEYPF